MMNRILDPRLCIAAALPLLLSGGVALAQMVSPAVQANPVQQQPAGVAAQVADLEQALSAALQENPELLFERSRLEQTRAAVGVAFSEWLPRLLLTNNDGGKRVQTNSKTRSLRDYHYNFHDYTLELRQNLFNGFATRARNRKAELQLRADELRLAQKTQAKALEVVSVYVELQRVRANYANVKAARDSVGELLAKVRRRGTAGLLAPVEVQRVESRFLSIENLLYDQFRAVMAADTAFHELTRRNAATRLQQITAYRGYSIQDIPRLSLEQLRQQANQHPMRLQAELIQLIRQEDRREARSPYFPQVDAVLRHNKGHNTNGYTNIPGNNQEDTAAQLVLTWTLFDGFGTPKRVESAKYAEESAVHALADVEARLEKRVADAWNELNIVASRLNTSRAAATSARATADNYEELVLSGRRTLVEGVNVIEELMRARMELNTQEHMALLVSYRLAVESGVFDPSAVVAASGQPAR